MKRRPLFWCLGSMVLMFPLDALAQAKDNPGPGWYLVDTHGVRYFVPGTKPPVGAVASGKDTQAASKPEEPPGPGWYLSDTQGIRYFVPGNQPPLEAAKATGKLAESLASGGQAPGGWYQSGSETFRYWVPGSQVPHGAIPAGSASMADPLAGGTSWFLADTQAIRYWVSGSTPPEGASPAGPNQLAGGADGVGTGWYLANAENVRYFVPGTNPEKDGSGEEEIVEEARVGSGVDEQVVPVASGVRTQDLKTPAKKGPLLETGKNEWRPVAQRRERSGAFINSYTRYRVPRYNNVEYAWEDFDQFKKQRRNFDSVEMTYRYVKKRDLGGDVVIHDTGFRKEVQKRPAAWRDEGPIPDPSLDKPVGRGFAPPIREDVDFIFRDLLTAREADLSRTAAAVAPNFGTFQQTIGYAADGGLGAQSARSSNARRSDILTGATKVQAKGAASASGQSSLQRVQAIKPLDLIKESSRREYQEESQKLSAKFDEEDAKHRKKFAEQQKKIQDEYRKDGNRQKYDLENHKNILEFEEKTRDNRDEFNQKHEELRGEIKKKDLE